MKEKFIAIIACIGAGLMPAFAEHRTAISIAFGDNPEVDKAALELAIARVAERGVDVSVSYLQSEDIAAQAVLSGQADIGVGAPYALIRDHDQPLRMFYQLSRLRFFPVVNAAHYQNWQDLDGAAIYVHGAGSGTEAMMLNMADEAGITYGAVNYLPGSGVRMQAMLRGRIHATIIDAQRKYQLMAAAGDQFIVLPMPDTPVSDDVLFAKQAFLETHEQELTFLVEELLHVWRGVNADPTFVVQGLDGFGLLDQKSAGEIAEIQEFYDISVASGAFSDVGGYNEVEGDLTLYRSLNGDQGVSDIAAFWSFAPLETALQAVDR